MLGHHPRNWCFQERDNLERLLEESRAQQQLMEQKREAQIAALHSQLYQARSSLQETHRETLATQAELHGSKQVESWKTRPTKLVQGFRPKMDAGCSFVHVSQ